jgi:hypothetical protein
VKEKTEMKKTTGPWAVVLAGVLMLAWVVAPALAGESIRTYTTNADFDEGVYAGVGHTTPDQLELTTEAGTLPFIWVPNENGSISKVNTETGKEVGRYRISPPSLGSTQPSRTTVDLDGSCWVGVRDAGTVVKVGLYEAGKWIDRNGDGVCQTSQDSNNDGNITGAEILPWGQDECVLYEVVLYSGHQGTYAPGTYPGPYDTDYWGTAPRGLAIDGNNNLWAGTWSSMRFYYIEGSTGTIKKNLYIGWPSYGAVIDGNGILWSATQVNNRVLRLNPSTDTWDTLYMGHFVYGLGLDYPPPGQPGHLFVSGWEHSSLSRVNLSTGAKEWTKWGPWEARGLACTRDNDVWVACTYYDRVYRFDNNGNYKTDIYVALGSYGDPTGVAVDAAGKVWVCNLDGYIHRINPATNTVDLSKYIVDSGGHYSYSDMTGIVAWSITTRKGTWKVVYDSGAAARKWGVVSWTSDEPDDSSVTAVVAASEDNVSYGPGRAVSNGVGFYDGTVTGRYLKVTATLEASTDRKSPTLYDLTVRGGSLPDNVMGRAKPGKVDLVWTLCGADAYHVYRSSVSGGPYTYLGAVGSTTYVYVDTTVINGQTYYYVVRPVVGGGETSQSNEAAVYVPTWNNGGRR